MAARSTRRATVAAVPAAAIVLALTTPQQAVALPRPDYPSWDEVQAARGDERRTQAEIERIEGILVRLEQEAAALGTIALQRGEEYAIAEDALATATSRLARIRAQAESAQEQADDSERRIAVIVAELARSGGGDVSVGLLLGAGGSADRLLSRLGIADRLGDSSAALLDRAIYDKKTAEALAADARAAEKERRRLASEAQEAYEAAEDAAVQAEAQASAQRDDVDRMYAQLAALKGTTADLERAYQEGLIPVTDGTTDPGAAPPAPTIPTPSPSPSAPTAEPTPEQPATPSPAPTTPPSTPAAVPDPGPPSASAVETAIAFATAQLGDRYELGAMGPDAWDCSGLTKASYAAAGVYIGTHSATNQYNTAAARGALVPVGQAQRGDLLFYATGGSTTATKYHVTLYLGSGLMLEAPRPGAPVRIVAVRGGDLVPYAGRPT